MAQTPEDRPFNITDHPAAAAQKLKEQEFQADVTEALESLPVALMVGGVGFAVGWVLGTVASMALGDAAISALQMAAPHLESLSSWAPAISQHMTQIEDVGETIGKVLGPVVGFLSVEVDAVKSGRELRRQQRIDNTPKA